MKSFHRNTFKMKLILVAILLAISSCSDAQKGKLTTINCRYEMIQHFWGSQYTCVGQNVLVDDYETYVTAATGMHMAGKTNRDVEAVYFEGQRTTYIPFDLTTAFPNFVALRVQHSGLTELNQTTFRNLRQLRFIHLDDNEIEFVPRKTFSNLVNLEWLSFGANRLRALDSDLLRGLTGLKYFSVSENQIEVIGSSLFRDSVNLERIFFYNNRLRMVGWKLVRLITNLKQARFDGNVCTNIAIKEEANISDRLTAEFTQKCPVNCSKAMEAANDRSGFLAKESEKLTRKVMKNKMEKQSLRYDCANM